MMRAGRPRSQGAPVLGFGGIDEAGGTPAIPAGGRKLQEGREHARGLARPAPTTDGQP